LTAPPRSLRVVTAPLSSLGVVTAPLTMSLVRTVRCEATAAPLPVTAMMSATVATTLA
jgi:hypothetical protein